MCLCVSTVPTEAIMGYQDFRAEVTAACEPPMRVLGTEPWSFVGGAENALNN